MKKKIVSLILGIVFSLQMTPVAFAASTPTIEITFTYSASTIGNTTNNKTVKTTLNSKKSSYTTISSIFEDLSKGILVGPSNTTYTVDSTEPVTIKIPQSQKYEESISKKVIISGASTDSVPAGVAEDGSEEVNDAFNIVSSGGITIQVGYSSRSSYENKITFTKGLEVQSGATLILDNNTKNEASGATIKYEFQENVIVAGSLEFNGNIEGTGSGSGGTSGPVTFSNGATMTVKENGTVNLVSVAVSGSDTSTSEPSESNDPLITVEKGGQLTSTSYATSYPTVTYAGTSILVKGGASLELKAGEVKSTTSDPAVKVEQGGTVTITEKDLYAPEITAPKVTTNGESGDAIDLAAGATVVTDTQSVKVSEASKEGDSYVDNYGNLILPSGGTSTTTGSEGQAITIASNTVITPEGTVVTGYENLPNVDENGNVTAAAGGANVTINGGESFDMSENEEVGDLNIVVPAEDEYKDPSKENSCSIQENGTVALSLIIAKTELKDAAYDISWRSNDPTIATVTVISQDFKKVTVTGIKAGTTQIVAELKLKDDSEDSQVTLPRGGIVALNDSLETSEGGSGERVPTATFKVTVTSSSSSSSSRPSYSITAPTDVDNGTVTVSSKSAKSGRTVTLTATPDEGYQLDSLTVTDARGNVLKLTDQGDGKYTFVMPSSKVTIDAVFTAVVPPTPPTCDGGKDCPAYHLTDVDPTQWYHEGVDYVVSHGMMAGVTPTTFAPNDTTTRGMIVTILYRLEGSPAVTAANPFTDVAADQWYGNAVLWAAENGVVTGDTPTTFSPDDPITREQMAAILYRYASLKGYDVTEKADLSDYTDAATISGYAETAMDWANAEGLITGTTPSTLAPQGNALRAQVAAILMRFCQNVAQ